MTFDFIPKNLQHKVESVNYDISMKTYTVKLKQGFCYFNYSGTVDTEKEFKTKSECIIFVKESEINKFKVKDFWR